MDSPTRAELEQLYLALLKSLERESKGRPASAYEEIRRAVMARKLVAFTEVWRDNYPHNLKGIEAAEEELRNWILDP